MHGDAAVAHIAPGVAAAPQVPVHVGAHAVRAAAHAVDREIAEGMNGSDGVPGGHIADHDSAARHDVDLLEVRRERDAVGNRAEHLFADHHVDAPARIHAIHV